MDSIYSISVFPITIQVQLHGCSHHELIPPLNSTPHLSAWWYGVTCWPKTIPNYKRIATKSTTSLTTCWMGQSLASAFCMVEHCAVLVMVGRTECIGELAWALPLVLQSQQKVFHCSFRVCTVFWNNSTSIDRNATLKPSFTKKETSLFPHCHWRLCMFLVTLRNLICYMIHVTVLSFWWHSQLKTLLTLTVHRIYLYLGPLVVHIQGCHQRDWTLRTTHVPLTKQDPSFMVHGTSDSCIQCDAVAHCAFQC